MTEPVIPGTVTDYPTPPGLTAVRYIQDGSYPLNIYYGHPWEEVAEDGTVLVSKADLKAALDILTRYGRVIICGPPCSGKTRLADALYKVLTHQGFKGKSCMGAISTCHTHILYMAKDPTRYLCIEDGSFGYLRVKTKKYRECLNFLFETQYMWDRPLPPVSSYSAFLIITTYPHILQDMQFMDEGALNPIADPKVVHHLTRNPRNPALPLEPSLLNMAWFICQMMAEEEGRPVICSLLIMVMKGHSNFLDNPEEMNPILAELGFRGQSCHQLEQLTEYLRGFILPETGPGFISRFMYDAVGIAIGRAYAVTMTLTVCDSLFVAEYIRMDPDARQPESRYLDIRTNCPYLSVENNIAFPREQWMERVYQGLAVDALLMEFGQHPSLGYFAIVEEFDVYIAREKNRKERVMNAVDAKYKLPLVYWSVWSSSPHLNHWCFASLEDGIKKNKQLTEPLLTCLLASILFAESGDSPLVLAGGLVKELAHHKLKCPKEGIKLILPIPTLRKEEAKVRLDQVKKRMEVGLCYLENTELPLPESLIMVDIMEDCLTVRVPSESWYLLLRLLTDKQPEERDDKGNTVLHLAVQTNDQDVIKVVAKSGASLTEKNKKGATPYQLARKTRQLTSEKELPTLESSLHCACREGKTDLVRVLLCQGASVGEKDDKGDTPLHVACSAGNMELVTLMLQLKADVNARNGRSQTPVQEASAMGHQEVVRLLVQHGANVGSK